MHPAVALPTQKNQFGKFSVVVKGLNQSIHNKQEVNIIVERYIQTQDILISKSLLHLQGVLFIS